MRDRVRLAGSAILVRDGRHGPEVYLTRRSARSAFAPDAFVFPGGTVDPADGEPQILARTLGIDDAAIDAQFGRIRIDDALPCDISPIAIDAAPALLVAVLRETFEEAGILIAATGTGGAVPPDRVADPQTQDERHRLRTGASTFAQFLRRRAWFADARRPALFSHWVTPPIEPRRYDTYFFVVPAPAGQTGRADAFETHDGIWIAPADALERRERGTLHLVYPTRKHLDRLAAFPSLDRLMEFASTKPVVTILPNATAGGEFSLPPQLERAW